MLLMCVVEIVILLYSILKSCFALLWESLAFVEEWYRSGMMLADSNA